MRQLKLSVDDVIEVGQRVQIRRYRDPEHVYYYSNVQDVDDESIYVLPPTNERGMPIALVREDVVEVTFVSRGRRLGFIGQVTGIKKEPFFMIAISKGDTVYSVEMREHFRVPTDLRYTARKAEKIKREDDKEVFTGNGNPFKGTVHDVSGGGMLITAPPEVKIEVGEYLLLSTYLDLIDFFLDEIPAEVVRKHRFPANPDRHGYGIKFIINDDKLRERIIRYCFARQRELRRRGVI